MLKTISVALLLIAAASGDDGWSWVSDSEEIGGNSTTGVEEVVEDILLNGRQGRNLDQFSEVYEDPQVQQALQAGNDTSARHYIRDRLCNLGLMACDDDVSPKRGGHVSPHDVIYAQPVALKPVGHPIAAVPVRGPNHHGRPDISGPYGPPRPVPLPGKYGPPSHPGLRPPRPVYSGPGPRPFPVFEKPSFESPSGPALFEGSGPSGPSYIDKVHSNDKSTVVVNAQGGTNGGSQQHVHHHYHHDATSGITGVQKPLVVERPVIVERPVPTHGATPIYESSGFSGGFNGIQSGGHGIYGSGSGGNYVGQSPFYKKEFNLNGAASSYTPSSSSYSPGSSYHTPRADSSDSCTCVPIDQCASYDIVARKDEGFGIDPRNNKEGLDIEAFGLDDVVVTDGNGTIISPPSKTKREDNVTSEVEEVSAVGVDSEKKERRRREAETKSDGKNIEPRLGGAGLGELSKVKLAPTFGVSFGLPQPGSYPVNPFGGYPAPNPYGPSIGPNGLNLGPLSVNPLLSVQVTKDEFGDKVVKPLVNLHVTPNHGLVHKIGSLIHKHKHYHQHSYDNPHIIHDHPHKPHYKPSYHHDKPYSGSYGYHDKPYTGSYGFHEKPYAGSYGYHDAPGPYQGFQGGYNDFGNSHGGYENYNPSGYAEDYQGYGYNDDDDYYRSGKELEGGDNYAKIDITAPEKESSKISFPRDKRDTSSKDISKRQAYYQGSGRCGPRHVCCRRQPVYNHRSQCGRRHAQGINGRIKTPAYVDGESEFGEYPWQVAILKKDPQESVYVCGGTLIDNQHIITAAHCIKNYGPQDLRVRLGEWDVNHDVEFYPYIERDVSQVIVHPEFYAGTLYNDLAVVRIDRPLDTSNSPHISPACMPDAHSEFAGSRCWTTGWGKDAFGDYGKYQNILKEVDVPVISSQQCQAQLQQTRLGYDFKLHPGFVCAGGEEGKDACKGDGGGPLVCERSGTWHVVGVVSWGVGCGQRGVPGVYVKVAHYLDWIKQVTNRF